MKRQSFKPVTITTKQNQTCAACHAKLQTGSPALASFEKNRFGNTTTSVFVCDADCMVDFKSRNRGKRTDEDFLNRLSVQFN